MALTKAKERGWLIILRADLDYKADGGEDEAWTCIFRSLDRAKEDCKQYLRDRISDGDELETDEIEWAEDRLSDSKRKVYYGRPKAIDDYFQVYQVYIE